MAQFPITDQDGVAEAVNYLLSGPSSSGQNFQGYSTDTIAKLTGNYRIPYIASYGYLTVPPIALSNSYWLDPITWKYEFATPQANPPFANGNNVTVSGVSNTDYDGDYDKIGVIYCDQNYAIVRSTGAYPDPGAPGTGGTIELLTPINSQGKWYSTDCNSKITVTGGTDRVFISAQLNNQYGFKLPQLATMMYTVAINRYVASPNNDPTNPEFVFDLDKTVAQQYYMNTYNATGTGIEAAEATPTTQVAVSTPLQKSYYLPNVTSTTGTGSGANITVTIAANASGPYTTANTEVTIEYGIAGPDAGEGYNVGDTITIPGSAFGGVDGVNDLLITVTSVVPYYIYANPNVETIFTTVIDNPGPGYYWYILEVQWFLPDPWTGEVWYANLGFRNLTAQLIKA